jgi:hypothetical protein
VGSQDQRCDRAGEDARSQRDPGACTFFENHTELKEAVAAPAELGGEMSTEKTLGSNLLPQRMSRVSLL